MVFQKHLLVYTVIIFCLSIGIILPVNYSGSNGEIQSQGWWRGGGGEGRVILRISSDRDDRRSFCV